MLSTIESDAKSNRDGSELHLERQDQKHHYLPSLDFFSNYYLTYITFYFTGACSK